MNDTFLLILSLCAALFASIARKIYADKACLYTSDNFAYSFACSLICTLTLFLMGGFGRFSLYSLLLGILFGSLTVFQSITNTLALKLGPMSYTTAIIYFSMLISSISGALFFGESISVSQMIGIALILICFILAAEKEKEQKKMSFKWLITCIACFLATGFIGVLQKVHQSSAHKDELPSFLIVAFLSSAFFSLIAIPLFRRKENRQKEKKLSPLFYIVIFALSGIFVALNNKWNLYLSGVMESAIFFPIVNGGGLVLATLAALTVFKEKLSPRRIVGIILAAAAIVLLCDPF